MLNHSKDIVGLGRLELGRVGLGWVGFGFSYPPTNAETVDGSHK